MFESPPERPQSVGDLIGRAFRVYRRHIPLFFKTLIGPTLVSAIGALGIQWVLTYSFSSGLEKPAWIAMCAAIMVVSLVILLLAKWILTLRQLAFVRMVTGFSPDYASAYQFVSQRKWTVFVLYLLCIFLTFMSGVVWGAAMAIVLLLPRTTVLSSVVAVGAVIAALVGMLLSVALIFLMGLLIFAVVACEDENLNTTITRGMSLGFGDFWRTCTFGVLLFIAVWAISYPLSLPVVALSLADMFRQGLTSANLAETYSMPLFLMVISQLWESLVNMLLWPVIFLAYGLFYYDLRLRQEGLDIVRKIEALEGRAA